jgi:putative hemolysin
MELLENFKNSGAPMAFVVDEYGVVQGIVTVHDLMEAITGEFVTEDPSDAWAVQRDDGSWLLDGHIPIVELKDRLNLKSVPEEEKGRYQTLSGMVLLLTASCPPRPTRWSGNPGSSKWSTWTARSSTRSWPPGCRTM